MQRPAGTKFWPLVPGRNRSTNGNKVVHLQHLDAADATRDAHIAAGMAFVLNEERFDADSPSAVFPNPRPRIGVPRASNTHVGAVPPARSLSTHQPQTDSIRFVRRSGAPAKPELAHLAKQSVVGMYQAPLSITAVSEIHPALRYNTVSDSNYSQYTSSLPNTPINRQRLNNTWSASQLRNKENYTMCSSTKLKARSSSQISTSPPRRTAMSQRHWSRPVSRNSMRSKAAAIFTSDNNVHAAKEMVYSSVSPCEQVGYFGVAHAGTDLAFPNRSNPDEQSAMGKLQHPPAYLLNMASTSYPQKDVSHDRSQQIATVKVAAVPPAYPTTSKSFLRPHKRRDFSFSSNDDDHFTAAQVNPLPSHQRSSLRAPARDDRIIRKSLRVHIPETPRPSVLPAVQGLEASTTETAEGFASEFNGSGGLRKTASRVSRKVRMRLRSFWSHTRSEPSDEQVPEQHIEAGSHPSGTFSGHKFMSEREGRLSISQSLHIGSESNETGTVVYGAREHPSGDILRSEYGGESSRFTSWSSSTRRTSSNASNRQQVMGFPSEHLPVISELTGQPEARISVIKPGSESTESSQPHANLAKKAQSNVADRDRDHLTSGLRLRQRCSTSAHSSQRSTSSSPSLASTGIGDGARQAITPSALRRLQNLTQDLHKACQENKGVACHDSNRFRECDDPFYDGERSRNVLFAFQSAPATPAEATLPTTQNLPSVVKSQMTATPQYFFRGKSPFRRALQESMKAFEGEASAFRSQRRNEAIGGRGSPAGDLVCGKQGIDHSGSQEDGAPLLRPDGARQWSRVQA